MNAKDYISSGLLEAYVLGSLSEPEAEQVAGAICRFPEVASEIAALEQMLFRSAEHDAVPPPPDMQDRIWAAIESSGATDSAEYTELPPPAMEQPRPVVMPLPGTTRPIGSWIRAAALALLVCSVAANILLWTGRQAEERKSEAMAQQIDGMRREQEQLASRLDRYSKEAQMAAQTEMMPVALRSTQPGHPMAATMYWHQAAEEAFVSVQMLPPPPEGMQYQLWAIAGGKPLSIGMLENEVALHGGMQKVPARVASAQAFAVSLEKAGGNEVPTADKIYLMGKMPG